jgi:hypothetical protein
VTPVQLFLVALFHLLHSSCIAEVGQSPSPIHIAYGGNCWDAISVARAIGGWVVGLP